MAPTPIQGVINTNKKVCQQNNPQRQLQFLRKNDQKMSHIALKPPQTAPVARCDAPRPRPRGAERHLWYICAMILKDLAVLAMLLALPQAQLPAGAQSVNRPAPAAVQPAASAPATSPTPSPAVRPDCPNGPCDEQPTHISIATPAPAPAPWPVQDRILWGANILLALLAYAGIMIAVSTLKKIERQTRASELAATAACDSAQAALIHAQTILHAERPWVLITVAPSPSIENGFNVIATNRGRTPARIVAMADETRTAVNEAQLPGIPEFKPEDPEMPAVSMILLPGEFTTIKSFCRGDVKGLCESAEKLQRIENWEERIFLYGKIVYKDLMAPPDDRPHQTGWFCRYIHGRQKSGLVMAGTQEYNLHT